MSEPCKVLITSRPIVSPAATNDLLQGEVLTFGESEPLRALETILARRPEIVALDQEFAATPRGVALAERIMSDPLLAASRVVIVLGNGAFAPFIAPPEVGHVQPAAPPPLDCPGTRRAPRVTIRPGVQVLVDGKEARLIDLSLGGAQVLSPTIIRPNKIVRIVMPDETALVRVNGVIAWARFEMAPGESSPRYRAGVAFTDADDGAIQRYCAKQRA
jgi:hypothetical protein